MRQNWLSNRFFKSFDDIVDHCCYAWNTLIDQPWKIMTVARRDWAVAVSQFEDWYKSQINPQRAAIAASHTRPLNASAQNTAAEPKSLIMPISG